MREEKEVKIKELEAEFHKRIDNIKCENVGYRLDGGSEVAVIWDWFRAECKKIDLEYPE